MVYQNCRCHDPPGSFPVFKSWKGVPWKVQFHTCKKLCLTLYINLKCIFAIPTNYWILISLRKSVPEMGKPTKLHA